MGGGGDARACVGNLIASSERGRGGVMREWIVWATFVVGLDLGA